MGSIASDELRRMEFPEKRTVDLQYGRRFLITGDCICRKNRL